MTIMNLTQLYLNESTADNRLKRKIIRNPDLYYASSIEEMLNWFSENPLRKTGLIRKREKANIMMRNIKIKEYHMDKKVLDNDFFDWYMQVINSRFFLISDNTGYEKLVSWIPRELENYKKIQELLCINNRYYVNVPEMFLEYEPNHDEPDRPQEDSLIIRLVKDNKPNSRKPKETMESILADLMPTLQPI